MKRMLRLIVLAALFASAVNPVWSAGSAEDEGLGSLQEPATLTFWGWPTADAAVAAVIDGFKARYPKISVDVVMKTGTNELRDALTTAMAAHSGVPDVTMIEIKDIDKFMIYGGLQDIGRKPFNAGQYEKDFVPYKWKQCTTLDGEGILAFPWDIGPSSVFYRRDLLEKAGYPSDPESVAELLSTWDDFIEVGRKVCALGDKIWWTDNAAQIPYIYYSHKNFFTENLELNIDNPKTRQVLEVAATLRHEGLDAQMGLWTEEWYQGLANGSVATTIMGCWFGGFLKGWIAADSKGEWGIVPIPEDPLQNYGGSFLAIPQESKNKLAAWAFIEYICADADAQNTILKTVDWFPAYIPAYSDALYDEGDPYFGGQKTRRVWADIAQSQGAFVTTALDAGAEAAFTAELTKFLDQDLSIDKTISNMESAIENQVAEEKELLLEIMK